LTAPTRAFAASSGEPKIAWEPVPAAVTADQNRKTTDVLLRYAEFISGSLMFTANLRFYYFRDDP
jgi:hypothetical protein